ncbi:MAG: ATP-binding protein, partial [Pseudomonadota bacterium]
QELFAAALEGRLGFFIHLSPERGEHVAYFSRGIYDSAPSPTAVVLVAVNLSDLEYNWQAGPEAVIFVTAANRVATSNRPSLRYRVLDEANARLSASAPAADAPQHTATAVKTIKGHRLWKLPPSKDLPSEALIISQDVPRIGLKAHAFVDIKPLRRAALSVATFIASVILAIGVIAVLIALQRRNMRRLLSLEEAANRRLEARVAERTLELQAAQDQLVQASKMTALGQMSAAIGHELNQPLAAILNFSDNGAKFLAGGRTEEARENFGRISKLVARIDRIITNLRGFARKEAGAVETTDLVDAIHGATDLVRPRLDRAGATLIKAFGDEPIWVQAGPVRLQQIFVNLLTNAIDAVEASNRKEIRIAVRETDEWIVADVSDTGGGAAEPERVFEPFYSTKTGRGEDGTGLGLSITFEVVRQFGGQITCQNRELGAVFELRLRRGRKQRAEIAGDHQTTTRLPEAAE